MKKPGILAVGCLLMASSTFAAEQAKHTGPYVTIMVKSRTVATLSMAEQPAGAELTVSSPSGAVYDQENGIATITGKCTIESRKSGKTLLKFVIEDGVVKIYYQGRPNPN